MLRELTVNEIANVAGAGFSTDIVDYYPPAVAGYSLVGWSQQIVGWDTYSWDEKSFFGYTTTFIKEIPIYDIQPIYAPATTYVVTY